MSEMTEGSALDRILRELDGGGDDETFFSYSFQAA